MCQSNLKIKYIVSNTNFMKLIFDEQKKIFIIKIIYIINSHSGLYSGTMASIVDGITARLILTNFSRDDDDKQLQILQSAFFSCFCDF